MRKIVCSYAASHFGKYALFVCVRDLFLEYRRFKVFKFLPYCDSGKCIIAQIVVAAHSKLPAASAMI